MSLLTTVAGLALAIIPGDDDPKGKQKPPGDGKKREPAFMLQRLDRNGDGKISRDELAAAPERAQTFLGRADRNGDGEITKDELQESRPDGVGKGDKSEPQRSKPGKSPLPGEKNRRLAKGEGTPAIKRLDANGDGRISRDEAKGPAADFFDNLDADKDGFLSPAELQAARDKLGKKRMDKGDGKKPADMFPGDKRAPKKEGSPDFSILLQRMDSNGDGKVSRDEARGPFAENFDRFDANKDGFLAKGEVDEVGKRLQGMKGMMPGGGGTQPLLVNLFNQQDADADGRVSKAEAKGRLADEFDRLDADKDGKLSRQEVEAGLKKGGDKPAKK